MLRIIQNTSVAGAMHYFSSADYYTEGQELTGHWRGTAAAMLGLGGEVRQVDWDAMCQNLHPKTGETLTQRQKEPRRVGYDFNFRAPKGLSLLYGLTGDDRLLDAFRGAVDATMREMEREVQTRVRKDGRSNEDRTTGNLAWGEFIHFTSRPVDGIPDPHLHAHCFAFNATWDNDEKRWKAGQFAGLKRDAPYFEARFHSRLAERLGDLGIGVVRNKSSWELAGLSRDVIEKFSRRTALIEERAEEKGITDPERKMELSTKTREKKRKELSLPELRKQWAERLTPDESDAVRQVADRIGKGPVERDANAADRAADLAVSHVFERKAVVPERTLLREALKRSLGQASVDAAERAIARKDILTADREGRRVVTTKDVLMEEQKMIDFAREGRGTCRAFAPGEHVFTDARLNAQQRSAVAFVLNSRDRVMVIRGAAGVGKTTMMKEAVSAIEASGTKVFTFAPSTDASRTVLRDEGSPTPTGQMKCVFIAGTSRRICRSRARSSRGYCTGLSSTSPGA
jgi:conjugative relaxase-like TrwC/TraI family protein